MITELWLAKQSFCSDGLSNKEVENALREFGDLVKFASSDKRAAQNIIYVDKTDFLSTIIFADCTLADILYYSPKAQAIFSKDISNIFTEAFRVMRRPPEDKIVPPLPEDSEQEAHCLCVLRHTEDFPKERQIICNRYELAEFRCEHFISKFPSSDGYFEEANIYLSGIRLHPEIKREYKKVFKSHKRQIHKCLRNLSWNYLSYYRAYSGDRTGCPHSFAVKYDVCEDASYEGSARLKAKKRVFQDRQEPVYFEPHLKMNHNDDGSVGLCRIYFEEPAHTLDKVYVGYICKHL